MVMAERVKLANGEPHPELECGGRTWNGQAWIACLSGIRYDRKTNRWKCCAACGWESEKVDAR